MAMDDDVEQFKAGGKGDYAYGDTNPFIDPNGYGQFVHRMEQLFLDQVNKDTSK
jgi:hypothetical protein